MSQRLAVAARRRRRLITYGWVSAMALIVIFLIYKEHTALLYILATLGVTALLAVVAVADLRGNEGAEAAAPIGSEAGTGPAPIRSGARRR